MFSIAIPSVTSTRPACTWNMVLISVFISLGLFSSVLGVSASTVGQSQPGSGGQEVMRYGYQRRAMVGVNACACCVSDQLSICCNACMKRQQVARAHRHRLAAAAAKLAAVKPDLPAVQVDGAEEAEDTGSSNSHAVMVSPVTENKQEFSRRLSSLRSSACGCCAQAPSKFSRCCKWCGTMRHLLKAVE